MSIVGRTSANAWKIARHVEMPRNEFEIGVFVIACYRPSPSPGVRGVCYRLSRQRGGSGSAVLWPIIKRRATWAKKNPVPPCQEKDTMKRRAMLMMTPRIALHTLLVWLTVPGITSAQNGTQVSSSDTPAYQDATAPIDLRVEDLLSRMTLDEKLSQIHQVTHNELDYDDNHSPTNLDDFFGGHSRGGVSVFELPPAELVRFSRACQEYARNRTRLGIPLLIITETLHGLITPGATVYPQTIAQGSTWNVDLIEQMAAEIAEEDRASGSISLCRRW
jgi:hypothetical protein